MGGKHLLELENKRLADINNFFILEYVKRNLSLDENQREIIKGWKAVLNQIISILKEGPYLDDADENTYSRLIDFFLKKQKISESTFIDCFDAPTNNLYLGKNSITIDKLNNEIDTLKCQSIDQLEALKYYHLYYIIRDVNLTSIIKRWDYSYLNNTASQTTDDKGNCISLNVSNYGNKSGILGVGLDANGNKTIYTDYDHDFLAPSPNDPRICIFKSSEHEIKIDDNILNNRSILVLKYNHDNIYDEMSIFRQIFNQSNIEKLYIKKFNSIIGSLLGLYIWDEFIYKRNSNKSNIKKTKFDDILGKVGSENILKIDKNYSDDHLKNEYKITKKNIKNVFNELSKAFPEPLTFSNVFGSEN